MNKLYYLLLIVFTTTFGQSFEGKILYNNTYKSKNPQLTDLQWSTMLGSTQEYFIKEGNYKSVLNGDFMQWQIYNNSENRLYNKMSNSDTVIWNDAAIQGDEVLKVEVNKNVIEILGYKCDEVILTCKSGIQKYYFNSSLSVNSELFTNHKFGNWFDYLSKSNAVPLKLSIDSAHCTIESIAITVVPMQLESKEFELPIGSKSEKSKY